MIEVYVRLEERLALRDSHTRTLTSWFYPSNMQLLLGPSSHLKGTVSPDIRVNFRVCKIKSVLYGGPHIVFYIIFVNAIVRGYLYPYFEELNSYTSFTESRWCSQAQFLLVRKDLESRWCSQAQFLLVGKDLESRWCSQTPFLLVGEDLF